MRTPHIIASFAVALTMLIGCADVPVAPTVSVEPVISVEEQPTMLRVISRRTGQPLTPGIDIFADGRCLLRRFDGQEVEKRLRPADVRSLLQFFEREGLFSISDDSIDRAIDRELQPVRTELPDGSIHVSSRGPVLVTDSSHTRISARTASQRVKISRYALHSELEHYRTVTELRTVQRCVQRVYDVAGKIGWGAA
jgi:hypothetical protein